MRHYLYLLCFVLLVGACTQREDPNSRDHSAQARTEMSRVKKKPDDFREHGLAGLESKVSQLCQQLKSNSPVQSISVHFIDLNTDSSFLINGSERYVPASLLKVSIMVTLFKLHEIRGNILDQSIKHDYRYTENSDTNLSENMRFKFKENESLTVKELITIMMQFSDNNATLNLLHFLEKQAPGALEAVEADLGAGIPSDKNMLDDIVKVNHFSNLLRSLYREEYLDMINSQQALELLRQSKYDLGMRKGIPAHIPFAHKYGVRFNSSEDKPLTPVQLHEIGIVFHPKRPFILAVMTKGRDVTDLRPVLEKVANLTYNYMESYSQENQIQSP